jgi:type II secretory pathway pseudopilin PulG
MAGRKLKLNSKLPASSILEVVIAMVLIVIVFGIAMTIFANVLRTTLSVKQLRAQAILQEIFSAGGTYQTFENRTFQSGDLTITETVSPYGGEKDLVSVKLEAFDQNKESTAVCRKIILIEHE